MLRLPLARSFAALALGTCAGWGLIGADAAHAAATLPAAPVASCPKPLPAAAIPAATAVFTGVVESTASAGAGFTSRVAVDRVYKGTLGSSSVLVSTRRGTCELGRLKVDERYVVMVSAEGSRFVATGKSGTAVATDQLLSRVQSVLGMGTAIGADSAAEQVTLTPVAISEPTPPLRAAAPGLALALVGALGWVVARRFA